MYFLARRFPRVLPYLYRKSYLSGKHGQIEKWLSLSLGKRVSCFCHSRLLTDEMSTNLTPQQSLIFLYLLFLILHQ